MKTRKEKSQTWKCFALCLAIAVASVALIFVLLSCSDEIDVATVTNVFSGRDCKPPVLLGVTSVASSIVKLQFDEPVKVWENSFGSCTARADGKDVYVTLGSDLTPGELSWISGRVRDYVGNTSGLRVKVWGYNGRLADVRINEFTTKGSGKSPDRVELEVIKDGNLAGLSLYGGVPDDWDVWFMFPDVDVKKGDFLVVWFCECLPDGMTEGPSGIGRTVFNYCSKGDVSLATNNGTIVLAGTPTPGARILDAVVYSNFTSSHEGFGTKSAYERAMWVLEGGYWKGEAISSTSSTATRSMSRKMGCVDSDSAGDWYVTVTSGSTFGFQNTSQAF